MVHRARERVRAGQPRFAAPADARGELLRRFLDALAADDQQAVLALLAPDVTFTGDGGGKVNAGRNVIVGADRVLRLLVGLEHKLGPMLDNHVTRLNGEPAVVTFYQGALGYTTAIATDGERITAFYRVLNPDKLHHVTGEPVEME
jgi:RNA polymerase sigma-70 factor (ECF subfamily)